MCLKIYVKIMNIQSFQHAFWVKLINEYTELSTCFLGQAHRTGLSSAVYNLQAITLERGLTYAHPKGSYCRFPCHKK
uniref:Putative ovule protein n=1 Tax=Solanum chacoense TaxID=4108 RepID=A0A0V0HC88_SOLCH